MVKCKTTIVIFLLFFAFGNLSIAQVDKKSKIVVKVEAKFQYLVDVAGVETKQICLDIENNIAKQAGVISFKTVGFPSKYFVLKASSEISESDLSKWLLTDNATVRFFGDSNSLEKLLSNKRKI